jgi:hypothetical protein
MYIVLPIVLTRPGCHILSLSTLCMVSTSMRKNLHQWWNYCTQIFKLEMETEAQDLCLDVIVGFWTMCCMWLGNIFFVLNFSTWIYIIRLIHSFNKRLRLFLPTQLGDNVLFWPSIWKSPFWPLSALHSGWVDFEI